MFNVDAIPQVLKSYPQWVVWRLETLPNGKKTKVPYNPVTGWKASVTNSSHWSTLDTCIAFLRSQPHWLGGIGFVLTKRDPFTFIDLDDKDARNPDGSDKYTPEQKAWIADAQAKVYQAYSGTYSEISPSGSGLHIIGWGSVPTGVRGPAIEVYSDGRYMTMTGNVHRANEITDTAAQNEWLWNLLGGAAAAASAQQFELEDTPDAEPDEVVWSRAQQAANGALFETLWAGNWQQVYGSQSEADFALIDILAFYTQSPSQIKRLFLMSGLGQRDKAKRVDGYVMPMIRRAFDRQPPVVDMVAMNAAMDKALAGIQPVAPATVQDQQQFAYTAQKALKSKKDNPYMTHMPGLLGEIAYHIYNNSARPVPEIALASAMGLLAGICGRGWNISGTGLNQYIMLLAGTGRGKETVHAGISALMSTVAEIGPGGGGIPAAMEFIGPGDIASGQALVKYLSNTSKSFVTVQGEFDVTLKSFTDKHANAALMKLRQILLSAYSRSGKGMLMPPTIYSDNSKNTAAIEAPAFSLLGEGTPERFFNMLDHGMVSDGLLPRFTVIYYEGERVPLNPNPPQKPHPDLIRRLSSLCSSSLMLNQSNQVIDVQQSPEAAAILGKFGTDIDAIINAAHNDTIEQIWNRAHLKALKLAALVAVGISPTMPVIDAAAARYAIDIVSYDTQRLVARFASGDIGDSETRQQNDVKKLIARYLTSPHSDAAKWSATPAMMANKVIPKRMLQQRTANMAAFKNDRLGATGALNRVITQLAEGGVMTRLGPQQVETYAQRSATLFTIADPTWINAADLEN